MRNKVQKHAEITLELYELYESKNKEYGDSFGKAYEELGLYSAVTQLYHKMQRIVNITKNQGEKLEHESLEDNIRDLANYAIMTLIEIESQGSKEC